MLIRILILAILFYLPFRSFCQTRYEQTGWAAWFNNTRLNNKWGFYFDIQVRSYDNWTQVRNLLLRPGFNYYIRPNQTATAGYLYTPTFSDPKATNGKTLTEHRIWEQYVINHPVFNGSLSHRFRLEQRFIGRTDETVFSQRLRYFFRDVQPLIQTPNGFKKGPFIALQNELFLNIQNKNRINGSVFDQNRAYIAAGFRASPKLDIEAGYLNQLLKGAAANTMNSVIQAAVYTRF